MTIETHTMSGDAIVPTVRLERLDDEAIAVLTLDDRKRANA